MRRLIFAGLAAALLISCGSATVPSVERDVWVCSTPVASVPVAVPSLTGLPVRLVALRATLEADGLRVDVGCSRQVAETPDAALPVVAASSAPDAALPASEDAPPGLAP
jgi:hypothetical protein